MHRATASASERLLNRSCSTTIKTQHLSEQKETGFVNIQLT